MGNHKQMKWKALWLPTIVHSTHLHIQTISFFLAQRIFKENVSTGHLMFAFFPLFLHLSGLIVPESRRNETVPEVVTSSGYALLHFFSDAAYNLTGFNIAYSYVYSFWLFFSSGCCSH